VSARERAAAEARRVARERMAAESRRRARACEAGPVRQKFNKTGFGGKRENWAARSAAHAYECRGPEDARRRATRDRHLIALVHDHSNTDCRLAQRAHTTRQQHACRRQQREARARAREAARWANQQTTTPKTQSSTVNRGPRSRSVQDCIQAGARSSRSLGGHAA